jgi:hypothetical protein
MGNRFRSWVIARAARELHELQQATSVPSPVPSCRTPGWSCCQTSARYGPRRALSRLLVASRGGPLGRQEFTVGYGDDRIRSLSDLTGGGSAEPGPGRRCGHPGLAHLLPRRVHRRPHHQTQPRVSNPPTIALAMPRCHAIAHPLSMANPFSECGGRCPGSRGRAALASRGRHLRR